MASGHDREMVAEAAEKDPEDPLRGFFSIEPEHEPGTHFMYNQPTTLAVATILQRLAGTTLTEVLRPRVLEPIGIDRFAWQQHRPGVDLGYSGVHTSLDAIARLGQLHLDDGVWEGRRLLPEGWVAQASSVQTPNPERVETDWRQGYGFQLWRNQHGYRGDGAFGQYMVVLPERDAVVAIFSNLLDMQAVMDLLWEHLWPALQDGAGSPAADASLAARLEGLAVATPAVRRGGAAAQLPSVRLRPVDRPAPSHRSVLEAEVVDGHLVLHEADGALRLPLSPTWTVVDPGVATSAATLDDGRTFVDVAFLSTPHRLVVELDPSAGTFVARWPLPPLFGAGTSRQLTTLATPLA
jgi:hypothetical protein